MNFNIQSGGRQRRAFRVRTSLLVVVALLGSFPVLGPSSSPAQAAPAIPAEFTDGLVANVPAPTDIAFLPDGRMLVTRQPGVVRMIKDDVLVETPVLDISHKVCSRREQGLTGITVDPAFATNHFIYIQYTFNRFPSCYTNDDGAIVLTEYPANRVSRFVLPAGSDVIDPASEVVLLDNMPAFGIHSGGGLAFGTDDLLYISSGDGGCRVTDHTLCQGSNDNARRLDLPLGKMLRVTRDGAVPSTNPWSGAPGSRRCTDPAGVPPGTGPCAENFATGLRNPFRFSFKPGTNTFYINDVGLDLWEEIDLGTAGADYGWNVREGHCAIRSSTDCGPPPPDMTNPIYDYHHSTGCGAITGSAFVPEGLWGAPYSGSYLFADYVCGKIFRLVPIGDGGFTAVDVVTGLGAASAVEMEFGPWRETQALYYTTYADGGEVRRLGKTPPSLQPPTASFTASPTSSPGAPVTVQFDAGASSDPDNDPLTYHWDFGDGTVLDAVTPTVGHVYSAEGQFTATLKVEDDTQQSAAATRNITVGTPPAVTILSPAKNGTFASREQLTLSARAVDGHGVTVPDGALTWQVVLHHEAHTHPYFGPVSGNNLSITYPSPEDLGAAATSYLEVRLTATATNGLKTTVSQDVLPNKVTLTFGTNRSTALTLHVADETIKGTKSFTSWVGLQFTISAPSPQSHPDRTYHFESWSDGKPQTHVITTPATNETYTANFRRVTGPPPP